MNLAFIRTKYFPGQSAASINEGDCYFWAYIVKTLYPHTKLWSNDGHAFVKIDNKFYDAERPLGVLTWKQLPAIDSLGNTNQQSDKDFLKFWCLTKNQVYKFMERSNNEFSVEV